MAKETLPRLTEAQVRKLASAQSFERAIAHRSRRSYQQAAAHLKRAKTLYGRLHANADWETYFQALRTRYANLRALQDELRKAQL